MSAEMSGDGGGGSGGDAANASAAPAASGPTEHFELSKNSVREIHSILKTLTFRDYATLTISESGLKVTVEDLIALQANAYLTAGMFSTYSLKGTERIQVRVHLGVLCECLNLFGSASSHAPASLRLTYSGEGEQRVCVQMDEDGVMTECALRTLTAEPLVDFEFEPDKALSRAIVTADALRDALADIDSASESIQICVSEEGVRLTTKAGLDEMRTLLPSACDVVERFSCTAPHSNRYRLGLVKRMMRSLQLSSKVSLRTDERGVLSAQFMIEHEDDQTCFVEYFCSPDDDVDV